MMAAPPPSPSPTPPPPPDPNPAHGALADFSLFGNVHWLIWLNVALAVGIIIGIFVLAKASATMKLATENGNASGAAASKKEVGGAALVIGILFLFGTLTDIYFAVLAK